MSVFFTSDLHLYHKNVITFCNRPWKNEVDMNQGLLQNWNSKVGQDDTIYILGDVFFCGMTEAINFIQRLNGQKLLVYGNHDKVIRNNVRLQQEFEILPELHQTYIEGVHVSMSHYPLLSWNKAHHGAFMLHGHVHSSKTTDGRVRRYDVGVDANNYAPVAWEEIKRVLEKIEPRDGDPTRSARGAKAD